MDQTIKNHQTLFRFVQLRSPELSRKEEQGNRFVFHSLAETGVFFDQVNNNPTTPQWESLQNAAAGFNAYQTEADLRNLAPAFFEAAEWIAANKANAKASEILAQANGRTPLSAANEAKLWDNLFYQVAVNKNFYVKELLLQGLVFQNMLKQFDGKLPEEKEPIALTLANATVVLPSKLFSAASALPAGKQTNAAKNFAGPAFSDAAKQMEISSHIEFFRNLRKQLTEVEKKYYEKEVDAMEGAYNNYLDSIKPQMDTYNSDLRAAQKLICENRTNEYNPKDPCQHADIPFPNLPKFDHNYKTVFTVEEISNSLPLSYRDGLSMLPGLKDSAQTYSYDEMAAIIDDAISELTAESVAAAPENQRVIVLGDAVLPVPPASMPGTPFSFRICSQTTGSFINMYMLIETPGSGWVVEQFVYTITNAASVNNTNGYYNSSVSGSVITLANMFNNSLPVNYDAKSIEGFIIFSNGEQFNFSIDPFTVKGCYSGDLIPEGSGGSTGQTGFVPGGHGLRQLGIADYKKVVSHVCCYDAGEVSHIENVMAKEIRQKTTTRFQQIQVIETTREETEHEKMNDSTSTTRFEMQKEIAKMMQQQQQVNFNSNFHTGFNVAGNASSLDIGLGYANSISKEASNRQAVMEAKDITQRAMERIVTKMSTERTTKTTEEFTEQNKHGFDNTLGTEHVSGVYRFINAIYKNQVYNYGKRLMYEFTVPQPAKLHLLGMDGGINQPQVIVRPTDPRTAAIMQVKNYLQVTEDNAAFWACQFNIEVPALPEPAISIGKSFSFIAPELTGGEWDEQAAEHAEIVLPEGYVSTYVTATWLLPPSWEDRGYPMRVLGGDRLLLPARRRPARGFTQSFPVSYAVMGYHSGSINFKVDLELTAAAKRDWQKKTFKLLLDAYDNALAAYNLLLEQQKQQTAAQKESNPLFYRQIEQTVLRKNCISYLTDDTPGSPGRMGQLMYNNGANFTNHQVSLTQAMDNYGSLAKFMEQAFEWNLMSYHFYPFYWANRGEWAGIYQPECNDPLFRSFLQAGMARVIVTVRPGFEKAVIHYLATGQIWLGGQLPVIGDPLYLGIIDELAEQEYVVDETWETVLPTSLIALQKSGVAVDASGLPCGEGCNDHAGQGLIANGSLLGVGTGG